MKYFWLLKFRTMYEDVEKRLQDILAQDPVRRKEFKPTFKLKDDARVARVGRSLRSTSLDEIPQLFNIIKDQMSWVGPRPIVAGDSILQGLRHVAVPGDARCYQSLAGIGPQRHELRASRRA